MKKHLILLLSLFMAGATAWAGRTTEEIGGNWQFTMQSGLDFNDIASVSDWETVTIPHTWNGLDGQDGGNNYYRGKCWYKKTFVVDKNADVYTIRFNGANMQTDVYLNGSFVGTHSGGYAAFTFDVTDALVDGSNELVVAVDNTRELYMAPLSADFTFCGGLLRTVDLIATSSVHVTTLDYGSPGVFLTQKSVSASNANVEILAEIRNASSASKNVSVRFNILDATDNAVYTDTKAVTINAGNTLNVTSDANIANPNLWQGKANPYLYKAVIEVVDGTEVVDKMVQNLGIRTVAVDPNNGFFLNGVSTPLRGVAMHEDRRDVGRAITDEDRKEDLDIMLEMGVNYFRLAHYQHGQFTYNYLDSLGIMCWTEVPMINFIRSAASFGTNVKQQLTELIKQNYNHPSIVCWGLCNEINYYSGEGYPSPVTLVGELNDLAHSLDATRFTTLAAMYSERATNWIPDAYSVNHYAGWYYDSIAKFGPWADEQHENHPDNPFGVSEYGAGGNPEQHDEEPTVPANYNTATSFHPEEYMTIYHEGHLQAINERPYLWATSVWAAYDFSSDGRGEGNNPGVNDKGLVTQDRQIRKDAYYYYKVNWNPEKMVYITSRRYTTRIREADNVKVYSNYDEVELIVNGVSIGTTTGTNYIFNWTLVPLQMGENEVIAIAKQGGVEVARDTVYWNRVDGSIDIPDGQWQVNFQKTGFTTPTGYMADEGDVYGNRGNGFSYGWNKSNTANTRTRTTGSYEPRFKSMVQIKNKQEFIWEMGVENGTYRVTVGAGDADYKDSYHSITAEGVNILQFVPNSDYVFNVGTGEVEVTDGRLTITTDNDASNAKICFVHITPITVGVNDLNAESFKLFPNPVREKVYVEGIGEQPKRICILGLNGACYIQKQVQDGDSVDMSALAAGRYLAVINGKSTIICKQ